MLTPQTVWITAEGYQKLQAQLAALRTVKRPALVKDLQEMSSEADWRENSQLILLQNELALLDGEIARLSEVLAHSLIITPQSHDAVVDIGETVVLQMNGDVATYTIVSPSEAAPDAGRISYESPVGHALLQHKVGDEVAVAIPDGLLRCRIVAVG